MERLQKLFRTFTKLLFFLTITVLLSTTTVASANDYTPEQERTLVAMDETISELKVLLDRCEQEVCRQVLLSVQEQHDLLREAQYMHETAKNAIQNIRAVIQADLVSLESCEGSVCREIISLEQELLQLTNDYLDHDADGMPDFRDEDSDGDGIPTFLSSPDAFNDLAGDALSFRTQASILVQQGDKTVLASIPTTIEFVDMPYDRACNCTHATPGMRLAPSQTKVILLAITPQGDIIPQKEASREESVLCWGSGRAQECPRDLSDERIQGQASIDSEHTIYSWTSGVSDEGSVQLEFILYTENTDHLGLGDIEFSLGGPTITVDLEEMLVDGNLLFMTLTLGSQATLRDGSVCAASIRQLIGGGDCDDDERVITPQRTSDTNADGRPDFRDEDSDGDGLLTDSELRKDSADRVVAQRGNGKASPKLADTLAKRTLSNEDKEEIREHLRSRSEIRGEDFGLAIAYAMSGNERVREVRYDNNTGRVHVEEEREVRLLGFIPMRVRTTTIISEDGLVEEQRLWWAALARNNDVRPMRWMQPESIRAMVNGDFEYCPDGTMVETLADCPAHQDEVESAQIGVCQDGEILCPDGTCQPFGTSMGDACEGHANNDVVQGEVLTEEVDILGMGEEK